MGTTIAAEADIRAAAAGVRAGSYLSELESLRGLAILLVFWFHFEGFLHLPFARPADVAWPFQALIRAGHTGVSLFFVLSAFLLSLPFLQVPCGSPAPSLGHYARRRALRILPLYWTAVAVGTLMTATSVASLWRGVPHMLFLSGFTGWYEPMRPWSDVWWSLVTEVQFYILLPLLPLCRRWRRGRWLGAALLAAYGLLYLAFQSTLLGLANPASHHLLAESIVGRGPQFLIGGAAAWLYLRWRAAPPVAAPAWWRRGGADAALIATLFALARLLEWVMAAPHRFLGPPYHAWHTLEALLWATVVLLVLLAPLRLKRLWDNPLLERLGLLSYSIYMWHVPCAWFLLQAVRGSVLRVEAHWTLRGLVVGVLAAAVCLAISALTYRVVERPFLVRKARLS